MPNIKQIKSKAETDARRQVASDLGIKVSELDAETRGAIKESVDRQFRAQIQNRSVNNAVSGVLTKDALRPALQKLNLVQDATVAMPELSNALGKNAELLFKTYRAFVDAGFSEEQAFQVILTQMQRR